ncbi:MAG: hypothetical protein IJC86_03455 [Clostridia bacterium]|nr:hypothetical protein [Clostridia bacterium]
MKKTFPLAFSAVLAALSLVLLLLTGVVPVGTYAFPCIAGALLSAVVIEAGYPLAVSCYVVVSVMAFFLVADKEAVLYYICFLGFYPVLKGLIERIQSRVFQWIIKYLVFNVCIIGAFFAGMYLLNIPKESFELFGVYLPWVFLLAGNFIFVIYDLCLTRIISAYVNIWRKRIKFK